MDVLLALDARLASPTPGFLFAAGALLLLAFELLSWGSILVQERLRLPQLAPGGPLVHRRDAFDFAYIAINKLATLPFVYHVYLYLRSSPVPPATTLTVLAPVPLLFLAYDCTRPSTSGSTGRPCTPTSTSTTTGRSRRTAARTTR